MKVFLTGATGFVGMEVMARLLERGDEVVALVRAPDAQAAQGRLDEVLGKLWKDPSPYRAGASAIVGDVTSERLGLDGGLPEVDAVVHCAASIEFSLPLEEARAINVEGTRRMVEAVRSARVKRFVHVSTAYVAGQTSGRFGEDQLDIGQTFRNTYEQTKRESEEIVATSGLGAAIARPSIVVGESTSGWTPVFNVLYWPLNAFKRGLFDEVPVLLEARVDVVPVDYVADGIVALVDRSDEGVFNLVASEQASTVTELVELACRRFDRPPPKLIDPAAEGGGAGAKHGAVYLPYFDMELVFDDSRTRELLGIQPPRFRDYFGVLMDYADLAKWGKRGFARDEANERALSAAS
ncbi:MAG: SDR family oxidoreductase [Actinomycetota bacterium]|nr:SDR family oxidoreductase [Actinomycetota bacterium]